MRAFLKKELLEAWRTKKIILLAVIFTLFGIMSPLVAKLTPEIVKMSFGEDFPITEPTSIDSWMQFYKNMNQMGIYLFAIIFSGTVNQEVSKGTLIPLVTKGLKRSVILSSKAIMLYLQWIFSVFISFSITYGYTWYYFPDDKSPYPWLAMLPLLLFGLFIVSLILLASTITKNQFEALLIMIGVIIVGYLANLFEVVKNWNPISLIGENMSILTDRTVLLDLLPSLILTLALSVLFLLWSTMIFRNKKL
ncbi:ABC transporter permease [Enterococcus sp.]|uniref:ABC transporter permease n=1 Tax=Enterococcus sp. TaxID=35783 RepID=UPI002FCBADB1